MLLECGAADTGPSLGGDVLLMMRFGSFAQTDVVKTMLILRVLSCTPEQTEQIVSMISRNKEKAVPVSVFLTFVVINVVNHSW